MVESHLHEGKDIPPVDLIIRTGNEYRTSNFLPWLANGHEWAVYFCAPYWPLFRKIDLLRAIRIYDQRLVQKHTKTAPAPSRNKSNSRTIFPGTYQMEYGECMGAGKSAGTGWRQTTVLIRSDIFAAAEREHLDISDACNRALAGQSRDRLPVPRKRPSRKKRPG